MYRSAVCSTITIHHNRVFHKLHEIGNNANNGIRGFTKWQKKNSDKMLPLVGIEPGPLIASDSESNTLLSELTWLLLVRLRLKVPYCHGINY